MNAYNVIPWLDGCGVYSHSWCNGLFSLLGLVFLSIIVLITLYYLWDMLPKVMIK